MNEEIKEILDKIPLNVLEALGNLESGALNYYKAPKTIEVYRNTILDYITNLQEELKEANESITWWTNRFSALQKTGKNLLEQNTINKVLYEDYKSRCEKATEFIEEKISSTQGVINDYMYHKEYNKRLIELLQEDIEMYKNELNILGGGIIN